MFSSYVPERLSAGRTEEPAQQLAFLQEALASAEAVLIGAGAGLSVAAGFTYSGERFQRYFSDFAARYGIADMYAGGFFPYDSPEAFWGYWCRNIWINRYQPIPSAVYRDLLALVRKKDYFVLTTNVDHCFQKSGFDKKRLFYTQGDYGLFQSSAPGGAAKTRTYDNYEIVRQMILSEGFRIAEGGALVVPEHTAVKMMVPSALVPVCPDDGQPMTMNLRCDDSFVQDDGWYAAQARYETFCRRHRRGRVLYLELGVGMNTPGIIKFPFWQAVAENPEAAYACLNAGEAVCPERIRTQAVCLNQDIAEVLTRLR